MNISEAIAALDAIGPGDPEQAHGDADAIVLACVHPTVRDAYNRVVDRVGDWWYA